MWNKQKPKADLQRYSGKTSIIATGAELVGDLRFQGAVQVDGRLTGNLSAVEGMVRISVDGLVQGEIRAPTSSSMVRCRVMCTPASTWNWAHGRGSRVRCCMD